MAYGITLGLGKGMLYYRLRNTTFNSININNYVSLKALEQHLTHIHQIT